MGGKKKPSQKKKQQQEEDLEFDQLCVEVARATNNPTRSGDGKKGPTKKPSQQKIQQQGNKEEVKPTKIGAGDTDTVLDFSTEAAPFWNFGSFRTAVAGVRTLFSNKDQTRDTKKWHEVDEWNTRDPGALCVPGEWSVAKVHINLPAGSVRLPDPNDEELSTEWKYKSKQGIFLWNKEIVGATPEAAAKFFREQPCFTPSGDGERLCAEEKQPTLYKGDTGACGSRPSPCDSEMGLLEVYARLLEQERDCLLFSPLSQMPDLVEHLIEAGVQTSVEAALGEDTVSILDRGHVVACPPKRCNQRMIIDTIVDRKPQRDWLMVDPQSGSVCALWLHPSMGERGWPSLLEQPLFSHFCIGPAPIFPDFHQNQTKLREGILSQNSFPGFDIPFSQLVEEFSFLPSVEFAREKLPYEWSADGQLTSRLLECSEDGSAIIGIKKKNLETNNKLMKHFRSDLLPDTLQVLELETWSSADPTDFVITPEERITLSRFPVPGLLCSLNLSKCKFIKSIEWEALPETLRMLNCSNCSLEGYFQLQMLKAHKKKNLRYLNLSSNQLAGELDVKEMIGSQLTSVYLQNNRFEGTISKQIIVDLSIDSMWEVPRPQQYPIPRVRRQQKRGRSFDLSTNHFEVPEKFPLDLMPHGLKKDFADRVARGYYNFSDQVPKNFGEGHHVRDMIRLSEKCLKQEPCPYQVSTDDDSSVLSFTMNTSVACIGNIDNIFTAAVQHIADKSSPQWPTESKTVDHGGTVTVYDVDVLLSVVSGGWKAAQLHQYDERRRNEDSDDGSSVACESGSKKKTRTTWGAVFWSEEAVGPKSSDAADLIRWGVEDCNVDAFAYSVPVESAKKGIQIIGRYSPWAESYDHHPSNEMMTLFKKVQENAIDEKIMHRISNMPICRDRCCFFLPPDCVNEVILSLTGKGKIESGLSVVGRDTCGRSGSDNNSEEDDASDVPLDGVLSAVESDHQYAQVYFDTETQKAKMVIFYGSFLDEETGFLSCMVGNSPVCE